MKIIVFTIQGVAPLLMHSDVTANPLSEGAKALKAVTSKREKTDEDYVEISRLEFIYSCYFDDGRYIIPAANIEACLLVSAKMFKLGTIIKQALIIPDDAAFKFPDDKKEPEQLFANKKYIDIWTVKVQQSKNVRTRPIFHEWKCSFEAYLDTDKMNPEQLKDIIINAGRYVGLGDYRPRFGRFELIN